MQAFCDKLPNISTLFHGVNGPPHNVLFQQVFDCAIYLWKTLLYHHLGYHPLSIIYTVLFLIYSTTSSISILTQLTFSIIICHSVNESMKFHRYAELKYSFFCLMQISSQLLGDFLTIPYHLIFTPYEIPYIYYEYNHYNNALMDHLHPIINKFSPTIYLKNALIQFLVICLDETPISWFFQKHKYHIKRECITLYDQGLIALDWWSKPCAVNTANMDHLKPCKYSNKINHIQYTSKIYYQYTHKLYNECFSDEALYPNGDSTPILLVFPTFAGDSVSAPTRIVCNYYVQHNWRVIVYVKRGCGSFTKAEFLPLTTLKPFCLQGEKDYEIIIDMIQTRFPCAPKMLMGLSGGGAYVQNILGDKRYKDLFCGGIKIDAGMEYFSEGSDLDERQPFIANILGQFFDVAMMRCREHKLKHNILEHDEHWHKYNWDKILNYSYYNEGLKGLVWSIRYFVAPCYGFGDDLRAYLEYANPRHLREIKHPFLILDAWNDFMRNPEHILTDFYKENKNIIHVINKCGAHCIRREGLIANKCWLSRVAFAFSDVVIRKHLKE